MKKMGNVPKNKLMVVRPNASPGVSFNIETNKTNVIDIVILNNSIPKRDIHIRWSPNSKNGKDNKILILAILFAP